MKKTYSTPSIKVEVFEASEFVAACYKIKCTFPGEGTIWAESGKKEGLQTWGTKKDIKLVSNVVACNQFHKGVIKSEEPKANGYFKPIGGSAVPVYWWKEDLGSSSDYHATTIDKINWETNPNAS